MKKWYHVVFCVVFCILVSACAKQEIKVPTAEEQESRWQKFVQRKVEEKPYTLQGSLRFGDSKKTRRVNYIFWSNGAMPLRVEIMAGVGASIAKIMEDTDNIIMYFPQDKKALYMGNFDEMNPLVSLGMPVPISFYEMSLLLRGGLSQVLENLHLDTVKTKSSENDHETYSYYFSSSKMDGVLQLDKDGFPIHCEINEEWSFDLTYDEGESKLPQRVVISSLVDDYRAVLMVKERTYPKPYDKKDFVFALPKDTKILKD